MSKTKENKGTIGTTEVSESLRHYLYNSKIMRSGEWHQNISSIITAPKIS